ncbi:MAG: hypothetical protein AB8G95_20140 [Anaerolineae bacterium]
MFSKKIKLIGIIGFGLIFLFSCGGADDGELSETALDESLSTEAAEAEDGETVTSEAGEAAEELIEAEPTDTPEPTATPSPTPTPVPAAIQLSTSEEELGNESNPIYLEEDEVVFDQISFPEDGWLVIWPDSNGTLTAEKALGFTEIDAGIQDSVAVDFDLADIRGRSIQVALHSGRDADSEFVADADNLVLIQTLAVDTPASRPMIETDTLVVTEDGFLRVDQVQSDGPGWLAVYDESGEALLGFAAVPPGASTDIPVPVQWHVATTNLQLHLLQDLGNVAEFETDADVPAEFQGEPIVLEMSVGLPADIVAFDQPMLDLVAVSRVTSPVDGYIVAFGDEDENGFPERILGSTPIKAGLSEFIEIDVDGNAVTTQILLSLFSDSNGTGIFDFPEDDPIRSGVDPKQLLVPVRSDIEGLLAVDSIATTESLHVDLVAVPSAAWLVVEKLPIEADSYTIAGQLLLEPGLFYSLDIPLEEVESGDTVRVKLYINNPDLELFDPDRNDFPLLADERQIFVEVTIE